MALLQKNSRRQGDVGLGQAIAYFTSLGYSVSIPLTESQKYDLIVDDGESIYRVEVKTSRFLKKVTSKNPNPYFQVQLGTCGGNQSWKGAVKKFSKNNADYVFILTSQDQLYLVPSEEIDGRAKLTLSPKWEKFRLGVDMQIG